MSDTAPVSNEPVFSEPARMSTHIKPPYTNYLPIVLTKIAGQQPGSGHCYSMLRSSASEAPQHAFVSKP